jgi:hypothetical protein
MKNIVVTIDRIESNRSEAEAEMNEVLEMLRPFVKERGLRIRMGIAPTTWETHIKDKTL